MATLHHHQHVRARIFRRSAVVTALIAASLLTTPTPTASAAPDDVARQVADIEQKVRAAEENLQRMTIEAEAAAGAVLEAQAQLADAQQQADEKAAELAAVREDVDRTEDDVATIGRQAFMGADETRSSMQMVLHADGPAELLQQAATLDHLGEERAEVLEDLERDEAREERLDEEARTAVAERDAATRAATDAQSAVDAQVATAQAVFDALSAEKATLDRQLRDAEIRLLQQRGNADAEAAWADQQAAKQAVGALRVAGGAVAPTNGRVTSCYGSRWGTLHAGLDIAAPIGTPVYSPEPGVVLQAGPASGFGLAVAVQHSDGAITLYGHVNQFFVRPGQVVQGGEQIAEVGNRGQSTGPHLHFEVHRGGLYANRSNPVPWLEQRGISLGGGCG
ncbi:M23 family metallopeptidase [Blastococcus sp. LR1]|uniref:peptidoglycan DD-metalloendopeptidase family protein n=1 Tax=Blastococcus sp. LR1 TaxID=2877000 RepID=UPI001CCD4030|nr:M23 family metallopeptidase [Blastococcus sp. LR1]MCA0143762.1 peptidoglycan DD-metalloendopeptidase family protein [Blastococcus sp. LR1]